MNSSTSNSENMKKVVRDIFVFVLIQVVLLVLIQLFHFQMIKLKLSAGTVYKHELLSMAPSPRLILIGDSNVVLGIRSEIIDNTTDYYPINMGLGVSRGLEFMLEEVKGNILPGDIVVISIIFNHFWEDRTRSRILEVLVNRSENISFIHEPLSLITFIPEAIKNSTQEVFHLLFTDSISQSRTYSPSAFNIYGDVVTHRYIDPSTNRDHFTINVITPREGYPERAINLINSFNDYCNEIGATVCFSYPPIPRYILDNDRYSAAIDSLDSILEHELSLIMLNKPKDMTFQTQYFLDTAYHLTWEGAELRTYLLLNELDRALGIKSNVIGDFN